MRTDELKGEIYIVSLILKIEITGSPYDFA
jgi:hypothetical protein